MADVIDRAPAAAPRQHSFAASGGDLCWFEWGQRGAGATLVLLHATGFHARLWDQVVAGLPDGTHVIAIDLRGHGRSYRPISIGDWVASADEVLPLITAQAGDVIAAAGHSMGATCAARIAAMLPDPVRRAVLIDPVILAPDFYAQAADAAPADDADPADHPVARRRNQWADADEMIARFAARTPYDSWQPAVLADYCRWGIVPAPSGDGFELACPPLIEASAYMGSMRRNPHDWLGDVRCPALVLRGRTGERTAMLDFSISPTWPGLAAAMPHGRDMQWAECSHFIPMEVPDRVAALLTEELTLANQG